MPELRHLEGVVPVGGVRPLVVEDDVGDVRRNPAAVRPSLGGVVNDEVGDAVGFTEESRQRVEVPAEVAGWVVGDRVDDDAPAGELGETRRWVL